MSAFPNPPHEPNAAEVLRNMLSFGFSLLSPNDQQDKIEQISEKLAAGVADVERLEGETEEDLRRKQFAELLNKAPVHTQVDLFREFTYKFNDEKRLCEAILLFRQLDSNEQQETIEEMLRQLVQEEPFLCCFIYILIQNKKKERKHLKLKRLSEESEEDFRLRRFIKLCSTYNGLVLNFIINEPKKCDLDALLIQASGNEEIKETKQSRYAEYYLGLSIIWFKARWASDPEGLIHLIISKVGEGDHIIEKLVNETEEDFRLRRFTESFKQLQFSSQEDVVKHIQDIVINDLGLPIPQYLSAHVTKELALELIKLKIPNLRGSGGAAATQGGGQGAITQGGQGTSQQ
ncbi:hypothetical protein PRUPE_7G150100 [Prunus persica]|uniref:Uncharacterized protein n=1 Tax=Prunus persica TaxID=3760 RepID=A0A251NBS1_PRUPE|nr:uncharacterized protein LOC109950453 isoform X1 [Prunus persica]XP_020424786.1 uncharacterized protein LOC109950453 isoform X1 [Prunus persica]ONH96756.1 hypothetical protein PRUPE_7G150100 [Prunus persica]